MKTNLLNIAKRLEYFIDIAYNGNNAQFAKIATVSESTLSRFLNGNDLTVSKLLLLDKAGCSLSWLFSDENSMIEMYSDNPIGRELRNKFYKRYEEINFSIINKGKNILMEIKDWVNDKFGSLDNFVKIWGLEHGFSNEKLRNIIFGDEIPQKNFFELLYSAGFAPKTKGEIPQLVEYEGYIKKDDIDFIIKQAISELIPLIITEVKNQLKNK